MSTLKNWLSGGQQNLVTSSIRDMPWDTVHEILLNTKEVRLWSKLAAMIDYTFPRRDELKGEDLDLKPNTELRNEFQYCMTYALYIYYLPFLGNPRGLKIVKKQDFGNKMKANQPAYFIAIDDTNKRILLSIRGTSTIGDTLSDLQGDSVEKSIGFDQIYRVHEGIYNAAMNVHREVTSEIAELAKKDQYKNYQILVTGHSLGAGVCSMLGLLWNVRKRVDPKRFRCYSFASPLIVDQKGRDKSLLYENMFTVANSTDVVTRISVNGLVALAIRIEALRDDPERNEKLVESIIKKKTNAKDIELDEEENELIQRLKDAEMHSEIDPNKFLYPCGKIYWFVPWYIADSEVEHERYQRLADQVSAWSDITTFQKTVSFVTDLYEELVLPAVSDLKLTLLNKKEQKVFPFNEFVCYGSESIGAHMQGRYSRCFGKNIRDILDESHIYHLFKEYGLMKFVHLLILLHLSILFFLGSMPLPPFIKKPIILVYESLVEQIVSLVFWVFWKFNNMSIDKLD